MTGVASIDLFAGAGGLSLAAAKAGADVRLHVDFDRRACETLQANKRHQSGRVLEADVSALHGEELRALAGISRRERLVVIGGPPCQPFSKAAFWSEDGDDAAYRRARSRGEAAARPGGHSHREDERRFLARDFLRLVLESNASGFVFENVASLGAPRNRAMLDGLIALAVGGGYRTTIVRAKGTEYGLAQKRDRLFILGAKKAAPIAPTPTHTENRAARPGRKRVVTAGRVLAPFAGAEYAEPEEVVTGRWADHLRTVPVGWNYKAHTAWAGHPNPTFVAETRFWNFLLKLSPDLPSWTIAANPGPWTGPFHWDSRRLRTAEMAALQGFPRGYKFKGNRRERVRQIGNAAPPALARPMIASVIHAVTGARGTNGRAKAA
jgi:DNA (cytosine-5)-methyltransferase 1